MSKDWTGHTVVIPDQHNLIITGPWKKDRPGMWWWKCCNCIKSSGVMSSIDLEKFETKGMIIVPEEGDRLPAEYSGHPKENDYTWDEEYGYGYM